MNIHKNARLTPQGRVLLVRRITEEGWRIADAPNAAGISSTSAVIAFFSSVGDRCALIRENTLISHANALHNRS